MPGRLVAEPRNSTASAAIQGKEPLPLVQFVDQQVVVEDHVGVREVPSRPSAQPSWPTKAVSAVSATAVSRGKIDQPRRCRQSASHGAAFADGAAVIVVISQHEIKGAAQRVGQFSRHDSSAWLSEISPLQSTASTAASRIVAYRRCRAGR